MMQGEGNGSPLQCSSLENPRDGVAQSRTMLCSFQVYRKVIELYIHIYPLSGLLQNIDYSPLYYTVGPCCLFIKV